MKEFAKYPFDSYYLNIVFHSQMGRNMAMLYNPLTKSRKTISYARYLMSISLGRFLTYNEHVDHINNIKSDDRVENLQILSPAANIKKSAKGRTYVPHICPICGICFSLELRQTHKYTQPCCSRLCSYEKQKLSRKESLNNLQKTKPDIVHGTRSGYLKEIRNKNSPCSLCKKANSEYSANLKQKKK